MTNTNDFIGTYGGFIIASLFFVGPLSILFFANLTEKLVFSKKPKSLTDA